MRSYKCALWTEHWSECKYGEWNWGETIIIHTSHAQAVRVTSCNAPWVNLWSSSFSLCLDGVNISYVCGISLKLNLAPFFLVKLSKIQVYKRKKRLHKGLIFFFLLQRDFSDLNRNVQSFINKTAGKIKFTQGQIPPETKSHKDLLRVLQTKLCKHRHKNVTFNVKTCESLTYLFFYCN